MKKLTFEDFKERANKIHNGKYVYHEETYIGTKEKALITCPIHGNFNQTPKAHLNGQGCPSCGREYAISHRKFNYKPFLDKMRDKFGDSFSFPYIDKEYVNNKTFVTVKCNKCNEEFKRRPNDLLSDKFCGCNYCKKAELKAKREKKIAVSKQKKKATVSKEEYLKRFTNKFGNEITPFMDEYQNTQKEIHFKCNKCGFLFKRRPHNCLDSDGCPKCKNVNNQKMTTEEFIEKANAVHNGKYDYSESVYNGTDIKVKVICHDIDEFGDEHGVFYVTPHAHIGHMRSGCPKCSGKYRKDTEFFIKQAKKIHRDKYIYDNVKYTRALDKVEIICPIHGPFKMTPNDHLFGRGCPKCKQSHLENEMLSFLTENEITFETQKRFKWLGRQSIDFYLPNLNIGIECQGLQHFKDTAFGSFASALAKDTLKKKLCEENGVKLIYYSNLGIEYPYKVFEDKDELLQEIIGNEKVDI